MIEKLQKVCVAGVWWERKGMVDWCRKGRGPEVCQERLCKAVIRILAFTLSEIISHIYSSQLLHKVS